MNPSPLPYSIFLLYHETENKSQRKEMTSLLCWSQLATGDRENWGGKEQKLNFWTEK